MERLIIEFDDEQVAESFESQLWDSGLIDQIEEAVSVDTGHVLTISYDVTNKIMKVKKVWKRPKKQ